MKKENNFTSRSEENNDGTNTKLRAASCLRAMTNSLCDPDKHQSIFKCKM